MFSYRAILDGWTLGVRRLVRTDGASDTLTHGTWLVLSALLGTLTVGAVVAPQSPVHHWVAHWIAPSGLPPGTVVVPPQAAQGSCQPAVFAGTTGTTTLTFPQSEPITGVSLGECGDPYDETVVVQGQSPPGGSWVPLDTATLPWDGWINPTWSPRSLTALQITVTQRIPDAQMAGVAVQWTSFLP